MAGVKISELSVATSATDNDYLVIDNGSSTKKIQAKKVSSLPVGGTQGQILTKLSSVDGEAGWQTPPSNGIQMSLLWTNASPSANFVGQTLTLAGLSEYSFVLIFIRGSIYRQTYFCQLFPTFRTETQLMFGAMDIGGTSVTTRTVTISVENDQIVFSGPADANNLVPISIYGIK